MIRKRGVEEENKIKENTRFEPLGSDLHSLILIVLILRAPIFILLIIVTNLLL